MFCKAPSALDSHSSRATSQCSLLPLCPQRSCWLATVVLNPNLLLCVYTYEIFNTSYYVIFIKYTILQYMTSHAGTEEENASDYLKKPSYGKGGILEMRKSICKSLLPGVHNLSPVPALHTEIRMQGRPCRVLPMLEFSILWCRQGNCTNKTMLRQKTPGNYGENWIGEDCGFRWVIEITTVCFF